MLLTRDRAKASPEAAESPESAFLLPLPPYKITQQESIWTLELGEIREKADLVNLGPDT